MQRTIKYILWLQVLMMLHCVSFAQIDSTIITPSPVGTARFFRDSTTQLYSDSIVIIRKIYFEGNKKTRRVILLRELPFAEGDSVKLIDMPTLLTQGKTQILNLSLFSFKDFDISVDTTNAPFLDVTMKVKERLYLLPLPYLKPVDRNLNEWLFKRGASVSRLDYGAKVTYGNATGNNDKLRFYYVTGYTKQLLLSYSRPYIDKNLRWGINFNVTAGKNHEINYGTGKNKQLFLKDPDKFLRNFFEGNLEFTYRPEFFTRHIFGFGYNTLKIADTVLILNPNYLKQGLTNIKYPELYYRLIYQNLDYIPYPTKGYAAEVQISKQGFSNEINVWQLSAKGQGNWRLGPKTFYNISALGSVKVPFKQPFYSSPLLGYGDMTLRGYEAYVMDGVAGGLINATVFKQLANFSIKPPAIRFIQKNVSSHIPLKIYGKIYGNVGYAYNSQNWAGSLNNKMLFGGGFGVDIFSDYDFTLKLEFSFNQIGENGLYLHKKTLF